MGKKHSTTESTMYLRNAKNLSDVAVMDVMMDGM